MPNLHIVWCKSPDKSCFKVCHFKIQQVIHSISITLQKTITGFSLSNYQYLVKADNSVAAFVKFPLPGKKQNWTYMFDIYFSNKGHHHNAFKLCLNSSFFEADNHSARIWSIRLFIFSSIFRNMILSIGYTFAGLLISYLHTTVKDFILSKPPGRCLSYKHI